MGCDIHDFVELWDGVAWRLLGTTPFTDWQGRSTSHPLDRSYALFGFLAGVRDRDVPLIHPVRGLPADCSEPVRTALGPTLEELRTRFPQGERAAHEWNGLFGHSWATGAELLGFDYGRKVPCSSCHDRDCKSHSWHSCPEAEPHEVTVHEYLAGWVDTFGEIAALTEDPTHVRVVYAFDN